MKKTSVLITALLLLAAVAVAQIPDDAIYVGSDVCIDCHDDVSMIYDNTPHSLTNDFKVPGTDIGICEACHGPGSVHAEEEEENIYGVDYMSALNVAGQSALCMQCHTDRIANHQNDPHAEDIACNNCHSDQAHYGGKTSPADFRVAGQFCTECHTQQLVEFNMPYRHRVLEGEIDCQDCHGLHGEELNTVDMTENVCFNCHTEKAGPFIFEHEDVTNGECAECHNPHGSINDKLLTQDSNSLCIQCHYDTAVHTEQEKRCYECHNAVHGSNSDSSLRTR